MKSEILKRICWQCGEMFEIEFPAQQVNKDNAIHFTYRFNKIIDENRICPKCKLNNKNNKLS